MADESISFDIFARDRASGSFRAAGAAAGDLAGKMDLASKSAYLLDESLKKQQKAADTSAGATLSLARADKILADAEHALADGALEADFALKKEAEAAKKSGDAAAKAAAQNQGFAASMRKVANSALLAPSGKGTLLSLLPALIPVAAPVAGAVGLIGASFGAAGLAAGLFGLTVKTVLTGIVANSKKLATAQAAVANATTAATKKTAEANLKNLTSGWSPDYKKIIGEYQVFTTKWQSVSQAIAVPALAAWLPALTKGMDFLKPLVTPVAQEFTAWGQAIDRYFKSKAGSAEIHSMAVSLGQFASLQLADIVQFIRDVGSGVHALGHDLSADGVYFGTFGDYLAKWGDEFANWSKSGKARADVSGFLAYMHDNGGTVVSILKDLGKLLPGILAGASQTGTLELQAISGLLGGIAKLPKGWQQPLTEAAGAILLLSKTGVISTGLKVAYPKAGAGKIALAASLGMRLVAGAFIVPAAVMILGTIIPKDTSARAAKDFKNQPGIVVKVSDFLHTQGLGAWVDQYFSHPIRKWALTTLPDTLNTAASKVGVFLTKTIPTDALRMAFSITGTFAKLPGPLGEPFKKAHAAIGNELSQIQFKAAQTARQINLDWDRLHGKKVALTFGLNLPPGVSYPSRPIKGHAAGTPGAAPGWAWVGEKGPELMHFRGGEQVIPNHMARNLGGYAAGTVGDFTGNFPSSATIGSAASAMQAAVSSIASAVQGLLHINKSAFSYPGGGSSGPGRGRAQAYAASILGLYGWGRSQMSPLIALWNQESGWRWNALNASSGAYGIPQSLPASKMAAAGADWRTNPATQIRWGLGYIRTYGSPAGAEAHERAVGWYGNGLDAIFRKPTVIGVGERGPEQVHVGPPGTRATPVVLQVRTVHGATNLERALVEIIQKFVTVQGGDVQAALGRA